MKVAVIYLFSEIEIDSSIFSVANVYGLIEDKPLIFFQNFLKTCFFSTKNLTIGRNFYLNLNDMLDNIGGHKHKNALTKNILASHMNIQKLKDGFRFKHSSAKSAYQILN